MPPIILAIRWLHIFAGFAAFFVAPVAMIVAKGSNRHRLWGKIYFYAMATATLAALTVAAWRPNYFLLGLSVFSFHLCYVGYRALFRKRPDRDRPQWYDWLVTILNFACGILLIARSTSVQGPWQFLFLAFGGGIIGNSISVAREYLAKNRPKNSWFFDHMTGMLASYIAAMTAFSAVNFNFLPTVVQWLWPTVVGSPLIGIWIAKYKKKFAKGSAPKDVATVKIGTEAA